MPEAVNAKPLPPCPLCGTPPQTSEPDPDFGVVMVACDGNDDPGYTASVPYCELAGTWLTPDAWRRLAAPPLPPEVVKVLEAVNRINMIEPDAFDEEDGDDSWPAVHKLYRSIRAWIAAGRPGLVKP
jgi:hypothetical protein